VAKENNGFWSVDAAVGGIFRIVATDADVDEIFCIDWNDVDTSDF